MQPVTVPISHTGTGAGGCGDTDPPPPPPLPPDTPLKSAASFKVIVQTVCSGGGLETRAASPHFPGCAL